MVRKETIGILVCMVATLYAVAADTHGAKTFVYTEPIDGLSIGVEQDDIDLHVRSRIDGNWTAWQPLELEKEFDPMLRETNLVTFPKPVTLVQVRGFTKEYNVHPLRVADDPIRFQVASRRLLRTIYRQPRIIQRHEWGADDALLIDGDATVRSDINFTEVSESGGGSSARAQECERLQREHPDEFATTKTVQQDLRGRVYRWPKRYSPDIKLLVVHHTAESEAASERAGVERMRLLYQYHAKSRGWGDIGYHYVIDEDGRVYEGRDGGDKVVGGHTYCANVGTLGVAMMGNFNDSQPTDKQMQSLQWLLAHLSEKHSIDPRGSVRFHGKRFTHVVGHRDVVSTACPGHFLASVLDQVRSNVSQGKINASVTFPEGARVRTTGINGKISYSGTLKNLNIIPIGPTEIHSRPGKHERISVLYRAQNATGRRRDRIAKVIRSDSRIGVWQKMGISEMRVRQELLLPETVNKGQTTTLQLRIQLPREEGVYTLNIGGVPYVLNAKGREVGALRTSTLQRFRKLPQRDTYSRRMAGLFNDLVPRRTPSTHTAAPSVERSSAENIRIRLSYPNQTATLAVARDTKVGSTLSSRFRVDLKREGLDCVASEYGRELARGVVQVVPSDGITTISTWASSSNRFRGILECRVVDGELVLINELPLERYIDGLAEEPDSEPYEKQRAFAIAARSYAAHYMSSNNRKFPGKPYDGDDSPARFQMYGGVHFEENNPRWVESVTSTRNLVIRKDGQVVKTPYFSTNAGRTNSPRDVGWRTFPFAEVFESKADPWCEGMIPRGHGVGMSGCGAKGQALEGKKAEEILEYYYPTTSIEAY